MLVGGLAFRYGCHSIMLLLALLAERRPAPTLPDAVLALVPYVPWVHRWNFLIWLGFYVPPAAALAVVDFRRFLRFLVAGGLLSLLRGLCILATGLGPVQGPDLNAGMSLSAVFEAWFQLVNPLSSLVGQAAQVQLTKDLFFSGHTATTFQLRAVPKNGQTKDTDCKVLSLDQAGKRYASGSSTPSECWAR